MPSLIVAKFGSNPDVDTAAAEDLWVAGGDYAWPSAAAETIIVSTSVNDAAAGTGARTVEVEGIVLSDGEYVRTLETATMNGTTNVTLSNSFYRVHRAKVLTVGSVDSNDGVITVEHDPTVLAQIAANDGQTKQAIYTVPTTGNSGMYLTGWHFSVTRGTSAGVEASLMVRNPNRSWRVVDIGGSHSAGAAFEFHFPHQSMALDPGTDVRVRVTDCTANNTAVHGGFELESMS